jgi:hypothetical protein
MSRNENVISDLCATRANLEFAQQECSDSLHLLHSILVWVFSTIPITFSQPICRFVHAKIHQLPQGCDFGRHLIEMDEQYGGILESFGVLLKTWVYEPRHKEQ